MYPQPLIALFAVLAMTARAQSGNQASIEGVVTDSSGAVVPGAALRITQSGTLLRFSTRSNDSGYFWFPAVPVGTYELWTERTGFAVLRVQSITVSVGAHLNLPLSLQPAGQSETISVTASPPLIEPTRSQVSTTVDRRSITSLPVNGRDFISFALLTPGVTTDVRGGLSFGGQRAMNAVLVDGANYDDTFWGQAIGGEGFAAPGTQGGYAVSLEAVQEYQVNTNAYSAEFGRAAGGVINVITASGTNDFHGSAFWFYRDKAMNANDVINKLEGSPKGPYHFNQVGGVIGGPIRPNRLFFLASYDALRSKTANSVSLGLPREFRLSGDPVVASFQEKALTYLRARIQPWTAPLRQDDYLARADWYAATSELVSARWFRQASVSSSGLTPQTALEHSMTAPGSTDLLTVSLTSVSGPSFMNVARMTLARSHSDWRPASPDPEAAVWEAGELVLTIGRCPCAPQRWSAQRVQWSDTVSSLMGNHGLRAGIDLMPDRIGYFAATRFSGSYQFQSLDSFGRSLSGAPWAHTGDRYVQAFSGFGTSGVKTSPDVLQLAGFLQDEWRVRRRFTLNLGLRYDIESIAEPPVKNASPALAARNLDTSRLRTDKNNFAPRAGFAWSVRGGQLVVRGGYGIFYALTPALPASRAITNNGVSVQTREFAGGGPGAYLIPAYPNTICGPPDPAGTPPNCPAPETGATSPSIFLFSPDHRESYAQQGSLGMELRLAANTSISVGYLGVRGTHLLRARDINLNPPSEQAQIAIAGKTTILSYAVFSRQRPIAGFNRVLLYDSDANSIYHGIAIKVDRHFSRGFQFSGSYTLGKVIDDNPDQYGVNPGGADAQFLSNPSNARADRSAGYNDQRHRLAVSYVWQPPYAHQLPQPAKLILNEWQISGIVVAQSGQPYSGLVEFDLNQDGNGATDRTPGLGRNTYYRPEITSVDMRLTRHVRVNEHLEFQVIGEAFNSLNRANVRDVQTTQNTVSVDGSGCGGAGAPCLIPVKNFGTPTGYLPGRIVQVGVRLVL